MKSANYAGYVAITAGNKLKGRHLMKHANISDIPTYLRAHAQELGDRILQSYPPLHSIDDLPSPMIAKLLRKPYPAQTLAIMGLVRRWQQARAGAVIAECGTGKTHLLTGLCVAACRQKRRVRFTTAAGLVNELVEAKHQLQLRRVMARWSRYDLIAIDEVGYVPLAEVGAEFLFQVVAERAEKAAVVLTTNLPFSEWTQVIPNARLCKALLDRITDRAHILETGTESYRFRRTAEKQKKGAKPQ